MLRLDRSLEGLDHVDFFNSDTSSAKDSAKAERGGIVVISTVGSGVALDASENVVTYAADPSGKTPLGVLMQDVVNYDLTVRHANDHKQEVQTGGKVTVRDKCWVVTDWIFPGDTPTAGQTAYLQMSGYISNTAGAAPADLNTPKIGRFLSTKDEDGYAKVELNTVN
jgi:hypothetical protein